MVKIIYVYVVLVLLFLFPSILFASWRWEPVLNFKERLRAFLDGRLVLNKSINNFEGDEADKSQGVVYVLGGTHASLRLKFRTAADLYNQERAQAF